MTAFIIIYAIGVFITLLPFMIIILFLRFAPEVMEDILSFEDKAKIRKNFIDEPYRLLNGLGWAIIWPIAWIKVIVKRMREND